ncbi:hypothetical protein Ahy_A07g034992 [Arachis hypogaea]|uniref:Uncharacterized protein n=1 Tax=Arachis hypogaea TaxID=3818 RepID=A0A445CD79_ARAHY|nr:hypothetical protein Ahy_A07g034992 [Arachis hypogaea]
MEVRRKLSLSSHQVVEYEEVDQETDSFINEFLSKIESPSIGQEIEVLEDNTKPSDKRKKVEIEEVCEEVEIVKEEPKEVDLALSKCGEVSLPKSPSTTFKWVKFLPLSFTFPLEYGLIENDGQLRALCGVKSRKELCSGWKFGIQLIEVKASKCGNHDWKQTTLCWSRKESCYAKENSIHQPPEEKNHDNQQEDGPSPFPQPPLQPPCWLPAIVAAPFSSLTLVLSLSSSLSLSSLNRHCAGACYAAVGSLPPPSEAATAFLPRLIPTAFPTPFHSASRMSAKGKGKAISRKRKRTPDSTFSPYVDYSKIPIDVVERENQSLPAQDSLKFPNLYCELRFPSYNSKNLNIPPSKRRSWARAAEEGAGPSSSSAPARPSTSAAAAALPLPPPAPQPTYLLVQRLFRFMERSNHQIMHRLDRIDQMFVAQGLELSLFQSPLVLMRKPTRRSMRIYIMGILMWRSSLWL